jgi:hypothetical protein
VTRGAGRTTAYRTRSGDPGRFAAWAGPDPDDRRTWHRFGASILLLLEGDRRRTRAWLDAVDQRLMVGQDPPEAVLDTALEAILAGVSPEDFSPP